jgi:anaerobic selenocysteine-containing dehydrogenase
VLPVTDTLHFRTCPLCEATCGLELTVSDSRVTRIRGDRDDVFSHGFICPKGSTLKQLHEDTDRLRAPQIRGASGHRDATWDEAFAEIDRRLMPIIAEHGRQSVGIYLGNPNAHNLSGLYWIRPLVRSLASRNVFSASTVDQMPRHVSSGLMYGDPYAFVVPDLDRTSYLLILGANPYESNGSLATAPDWPGRLQAIRRRGGRIVVVDPRRTRTAGAADEHLSIRPGTDALFLCALINVIAAERLVDLGAAGPYLRGVEEALAAVAGYTPEAVTRRTGIATETIRRIARELAAAETAAVYGRVGVHTVVAGTVASWATDVLNAITGNLDRPGGAMWGLGAHSRPGPAEGGGRGYRVGRWVSRVSQRPEANGELPVGVLAEEIEAEGSDQIRALITIAGNPVLSTPHSERLDAALARLELMVCVDLYINETTRHADVILPAPSPLEKSHYDGGFYGWALRHVVNFSPPVFATGQPSESDVLARLTTLLRGGGPDGDPSVVHDEIVLDVLQQAVAEPHSIVYGRDARELRSLVQGATPPDRLVDALVRTGPWGDGFGVRPDGLNLQQLLDHPHGIDFGPLQPRLPGNLRTPSAKVELAPAAILGAVPAVLASEDPSEGLVLIGRRELRSNNSWMHNIDVLVRGKERCTLLIHPRDAGSRGLRTGDVAEVKTSSGRIEVPVEVSDEMMPGVVSLPHGWGHDADGTRLAVARAHVGVNMNRLIDGEVLDPLSGNARMTGVPVAVARKP